MTNKKERLSTEDEWSEFFKKDGRYEANRGREQTRLFAEAICKHTHMKLARPRTLLDSSCALGDAMPVFAKHFPTTQLYACDFSTEAIRRCREKYANRASFFVASIEEISGMYDVIYSSNTLEHFEDYKEKARTLLQHCTFLSILVPYNERRCKIDLQYDARYGHVVTFREHSFDFLLDEFRAKNIHRPRIFSVPNAWGWPLSVLISQSLKNIVRHLIKRPIKENERQILFEIEAVD